ncbi:MAG: type II secretion system protein [Kiritimatiellae bacterium]|nr:type II secretion system protein [Kiritimatiellia bacterium]
MKTRRSGFTLIEMMVVIGIIGILAAVLTGGYTLAVKSAQRAKAVEAVSNARSALEMLYQRAEGWPRAILEARQYGGFHVMDENVAKVLFRYNLLNVDCKKTGSSSKLDAYTLRGVDRCGIADPWAQDALRKADKNLDGASLLSREVSSGGTVQEHLIYFAVDQNDDGFVDRSEGAPVDKVRAKVITWCAGADGGLGDCSTDKRGKTKVNGRSITNGDNVYSWQRAQEVR